MKHTLNVYAYPQEGDFQHTYSPLKNIMEKDGSIGFFRVKNFGIDLGHPINLQCQPSYDGTVNLIINDDKNPPRIVNSRFSKIEDNRFRIINRNQKEQTNLYKWDKWDSQTRLFRTSVTIPVVHFMDLKYFGQLKGGNYTFYFKFADDDYNQTDILCESGIIPVFKGNLDTISSISGTVSDELTDKSIRLKLTNLDTSFSKLFIYYTREYSDLNGFRLTETKSMINPYDITESSMEIIINGYEAVEDVDRSELNIKYNYVSSVKTQAQVQNMLFFGNVENTNLNISDLRNISQFFIVQLKQSDNIGYVEPSDYTSDNSEYYSPLNTYYKLGYWPGEIYRLGVVYIMNDDSLSPVFPLRGCVFNKIGDNNFDASEDNESVPTLYWKETEGQQGEVNTIPVNSFLTSKNLVNSYGVFRNAFEDNENKIIGTKQVRPWYYSIYLPYTDQDPITGKRLQDVLIDLGVKGYFFVRQKRIPTTLCQGFSIGIENYSSSPCLKITSGYTTEGFLTKDGDTPVLAETYSRLNCDDKYISHHALLCVDAMLNPSLQSTLDGSVFSLQKNRKCILSPKDKRRYYASSDLIEGNNSINKQCIYINEDVPYKYVNGYSFSTRIGNAESVKEFSYFGKTKAEVVALEIEDDGGKGVTSLIRGVYSPIVGVCGQLQPNTVYNIRIPNYSNLYTKDYFLIRANDNSEFYTISDRYSVYDLSDGEVEHSIYRGDCYTNTVTVRLIRNFTDPEVPIQDVIVDPKTWSDNYKGKNKMEEVQLDHESEDESIGNWTRINRADVNAVQLGTWVTYKCLSNYNLGLRTEDSSYPDEEALVGNKRTFFPFSDINIKSSGKIPESKILNDGYSSTVGRKSYIIAPDVPYVRDIFDTRVMFSNVNVEGDFKNGYRVFQGLSYKDIDRQYGAIVKFLDWGTNLLCVFEHGIAILPINEKALIQTTTEQSIHMYGAGVLQNQVSLISPDFGSIWAESIIRTPIGVYGVDTYAKKIWRYTTEKGLETISDMKVQRFLNDHILLREEDKYSIVGLKNVKTHYNNYKGDVMFTFYNHVKDEEWHLCFNERMDKWITRYSWTPLCSENINNIFYSLDKKRAEILSYIYYNKNCTRGIRTSNNLWSYDVENEKLNDSFETTISLEGVDMQTDFEMIVESISTSYINDNGVEQSFIFPERSYIKNPYSPDPNAPDRQIQFVHDKNQANYKLTINYSILKTYLSAKNYFGNLGIPTYFKINVVCKPILRTGTVDITHVEEIYGTIGIVVDNQAFIDYTDGTTEIFDATIYDNIMRNGFYVHGRAGIFDEIDYTDDDPDNQIKPTHWYGKQEPFEFEFVVNEDVGLHKIFENLVIISNRVKPKELEFEITGDVYSLFKGPYGIFDRGKKDFVDQFKNVISKYDTIQNRHTLVITQELFDVEEFKRRLGNIHYKEDSWYVTIDPIIKKEPDRLTRRSSTRIRDKYLRVRVKYSGEDLVIITAIKNIYSLTHA